MNFDPSQLQALYQQYQNNPQAMQGMAQQGQDPQKMAQALMQFQNPNQVDPVAQQYGIQPGMSLI